MYNKKIVEHLFAVSKTLGKVDVLQVSKAIDGIRFARRWEHAVFTVGNGGSASTASHFANDLLKMCGVHVSCINDMTPSVLAYGNDTDWNYMFASPLSKLIKPQDFVVAFTCSGYSQNVISALDVGLAHGSGIAFTGDKGGFLNNRNMQALIKVPHPDIKVQEDVHLAVCHAIAGALND